MFAIDYYCWCLFYIEVESSIPEQHESVSNNEISIVYIFLDSSFVFMQRIVNYTQKPKMVFTHCLGRGKRRGNNPLAIANTHTNQPTNHIYCFSAVYISYKVYLFWFVMFFFLFFGECACVLKRKAYFFSAFSFRFSSLCCERASVFSLQFDDILNFGWFEKCCYSYLFRKGIYSGKICERVRVNVRMLPINIGVSVRILFLLYSQTHTEEERERRS